MTTQEETTRDRIILAAIFCIERDGMNALTIRSIAKQAGVNSAAINYYFGTKEKLLDAVLEQTIFTAFEDNIREFLEEGDSDIMTALRDLFLELLGGAIRYPNISKAHLYKPFIDNDYSGPLSERFSRFMADLQSYIQKIKPDMAADELEMAIIQLISALLLPGIMPGIFRNIDFSDPVKQEKYVTSLLDSCLRT